MKDVNKVILIGRLGADPIQRMTKNGTAVTNFPLATARWVKEPGQDGTESGKKEETQWHQIVAWGKQAEICGQYLKKGRSVYVEGSVRSRKYVNKTGDERYAFEVHAENVSFLPGKGRLEQAQETEVDVAV